MAPRVVELGRGTEHAPCRVGLVKRSDARVVRVVHVSDTHFKHMGLLHLIPPGDILIHSGDFLDCTMSQELEYHAKVLDEVLSSLPHAHKIFVAGNHERCFDGEPVDKIKALMPHVVYLQDEQVEIMGLKIYGSPWNGDRCSVADAFVTPFPELNKHWDLIPEDTDILVTHNPPSDIFDNAGTMGCVLLREAVLTRIQ